MYSNGPHSIIFLAYFLTTFSSENMNNELVFWHGILAILTNRRKCLQKADWFCSSFSPSFSCCWLALASAIAFNIFPSQRVDWEEKKGGQKEEKTLLSFLFYWIPLCGSITKIQHNFVVCWHKSFRFDVQSVVFRWVSIKKKKKQLLSFSSHMQINFCLLIFFIFEFFFLLLFVNSKIHYLWWKLY